MMCDGGEWQGWEDENVDCGGWEEDCGVSLE